MNKIENEDMEKINKLSKDLEDFYFEKLKENNFVIFALCKKNKKYFDSEEKRQLKNVFNRIFFAQSKSLKKQKIIAENFLLTNIKNHYVKESFFNACFTIDKNKYFEIKEKNLNFNDYLKNIENIFKETVIKKIEINKKIIESGRYEGRGKHGIYVDQSSFYYDRKLDRWRR